MFEKIKKFFFDLFDLKLIVISVFAASMWLKLLYVNSILFDEKDTLIFLVFTAVSVILLYSWLLLINKKTILYASIFTFLLSCVLWFDMVYYRYFESLIKADVLALAGQTTSVLSSVFELISILDILLFIDIAVVLLFLKINTKVKSKKRPINYRLKIFFLVLLLSISSISYILYRDNIDGYLHSFLKTNFDINLVELRYGVFGAHAIDMFRFYIIGEVDVSEEEKNEVLDWFKDNGFNNTLDNEMTGTSKDRNIYLIQLESFQSFVINKKVNGIEITPNINKLVDNSHYFPKGESIIGGGRTSDSDFSANTSIYPLYDSAAFVTNGKSNFTSLPKALKKEGYSTNAFHAYKRDFWNRGVAFGSLGYEKYFAQDDYEDGERIIMGLNDEDFYRQTFNKLENIENPQFNYLISLSSHHPFVMPEEFQLLDLEMSDEFDYLSYHYLQSANYADYALGIFIDKLKENNLYDKSLLVIYGDHSANFGELGSNKVINTIGDDVGEDIPYIFKLPNQREGQKYTDVITQVDLMPTILNLVGVKISFPMLGNDVFGELGYDQEISEKKEYSKKLIRYNLFDYFY